MAKRKFVDRNQFAFNFEEPKVPVPPVLHENERWVILETGDGQRRDQKIRLIPFESEFEIPSSIFEHIPESMKDVYAIFVAPKLGIIAASKFWAKAIIQSLDHIEKILQKGENGWTEIHEIFN